MRKRVRLLPYTSLNQSGAWYQDREFAIPVGDFTKATVVMSAKAVSGSPTVYLVTAPEKSWDDADWAPSAGSGPITTVGGITWAATNLSDLIRIRVTAGGAYTLDILSVYVYLHND